MRNAITEAITGLKTIKLWYDPGEREIEPHAFGLGSEGQLLLRAFQVSGASASGEHVHWKLFRVDRIASLDVSAANFNGPRPGYRKGDRAMTRGIISEL